MLEDETARELLEAAKPALEALETIEWHQDRNGTGHSRGKLSG
jgi:hypothetical protein